MNNAQAIEKGRKKFLVTAATIKNTLHARLAALATNSKIHICQSNARELPHLPILALVQLPCIQLFEAAFLRASRSGMLWDTDLLMQWRQSY